MPRKKEAKRNLNKKQITKCFLISASPTSFCQCANTARMSAYQEKTESQMPNNIHLTQGLDTEKGREIGVEEGESAGADTNLPL